MGTGEKLKKIAALAAEKDIPLAQVLKYVEKIPSKTKAKNKKYSFVFYWIRIARPAYNKKGFSPRKINIRLAKHPRFHHIIDDHYSKKDKKKFYDKTSKDYKGTNYIKDIHTNGLFARYKLCERLFKATPMVNKIFLDSVLKR